MKRRVLMVSCEGLGNGGVQNVMMNIVRNMQDEYMFDILLFTHETRFFDKEFLTYGGKILRIPKYVGENVIRKKLDYYIRGNQIYKETVKLIQENGPYDVVHCNNEFEGALVLKAAYETKVPIRIMHTHVITGKCNLIAKCMHEYRSRLIERYATKWIGCSKEAINSFYINPKDAQVVYNPYDSERFKVEKYIEKQNKPLTLIQIGRYDENKNQLFTIDVINELHKIDSTIQMKFVGFDVGNYKNKLEEKITEYKLEKTILFYPADADIPKLLNDSYALLLTSKKEGFGIVAIEAQAMKKRCFISDTVPTSTNCGGAIYLSINVGAKTWAEYIYKDYLLHEGMRIDSNVSRFEMKKFIHTVNGIYRGE